MLGTLIKMTKHKQTNVICVIMNNFDQSSTGLNIDVDAFRDTCLSRFYFEEAFLTIKEGLKDCLVYCEGNFSDFEKEYFFTKAELLAAYVAHMGDNSSHSYSLMTLKQAWGLDTQKPQNKI